jgi:uncharacterized repeat protein (TIGR01451 family)
LLLLHNDGNPVDITPPGGFDFTAAVYVNPTNNHIYVNTLDGIERSTNSGQSWEFVHENGQNYGLDMAFLASGRILAIFDNNLYTSDDNGATWNLKSVPFVIGQSSIKVAPQGEVYWLNIYNSTDDSFIWRSTDNGDSWVKLPRAYSISQFPYPEIAIANNGFLYAALEKTEILLSVNQGETWQTLPHPVPSPVFNYGAWAWINGLAITPSQHLMVSTHNYDFFTTNASLTEGATITGFARKDADADCSTADAQEGIFNRIVTAQTDQFAYYTTTNTQGNYVLWVDTGVYALTLQNPNTVWWENCDTAQTVVIPQFYTTDTVNFAAIPLSECPLVSVNVAAPLMRRCFNNTVFVHYCNIGTEPADSAWVDVTLDEYLSFVSSGQPHQLQPDNTVRFFVGDLPSGECGNFQLTVYVNCDSTILGQTHCIVARGFPDTLCTQVPDWSGANIEASVACQDTTLTFTLKNTGTAPSQMLDYIIIEDDVVMFQGSKQYNENETFTIPQMANGRTYRIESEQEPGHPFSYRVLAFEEGCGGFESLGYINQFSVNGITPSVHRICLENTGSYDPNDKHGYPLGTGAEHRIRPGQALDYMIRFQNTGTDTAFTVVIRDTLTGWLNPASVVVGASSHQYQWKLEGQGVLVFTFNNILLPDSTTNLEGSQGFVTFHIEQQADVPLGTQILNDAAIYFDFNAPVITNETIHTVGVDVVSSTTDHGLEQMGSVVAVAPNPAVSEVEFRMNHQPFKKHRLQVFDMLGVHVYDAEISGSTHRLLRNNLPEGAYGWRISDARGTLVDGGVLIWGAPAR